MNLINRGRLWLAPILALALVAAACGNDDNGNGGGLSGTVAIDGSSTVAPFAEAAAELFMLQNSGVRVTVGTSGTGGGFEKFCIGETDISDASRAITDSESEGCESNGITFEELGVANDALAVLVNPDNPVDCLSVEQLHQIWAPGSELGNWDEIDDLDVDFGESLDLYGPGIDSGTFDYFTEAINEEEGEQRTSYNNVGEDDHTGIIGVEGSLGGTFYVGFSYYLENQDSVKAVAVDGGAGCVEPSEETVFDGSYAPLARELFMYISDSALEQEQVLAFIEFVIDNADEIAEAAGFIGLTPEQADAARDKVQSLVG